VGVSPSDEGFIQDYDLGQKQELHIYCRFCRNVFPVVFRPKSRDVMIRCLCGHEAPLREQDVFRTEADARGHAEMYERVYRAAKDALRDAGLPVPPSQRFRLEDMLDSSDLVATSGRQARAQAEDQSDIVSSYREDDGSSLDAALTREAIDDDLAELEGRLAEAEGDALATHDVLSEIVEWAYCRRYVDELAMERFLAACKRDIELAPDVIRAAKQRKRRGQPVRLRFTSFKHMAVHLESEGALKKALWIADKAAQLGLKGYAERARALRARLDG